MFGKKLSAEEMETYGLIKLVTKAPLATIEISQINH